MARVADEVVQIPGHRVPPQDLDAERSVLGSMLLSTEAMADVVEILEADDFYRSAHGKIYQALRMLFAQGEPIDIITAVDALRRAGILDDVGGALYLRDLVDEVPTPAGAPHYAKIVSDAALRRRSDRRGGRHHRHRLPGRQRRRRHRRRRRAAHLRRRSPRGHRGRRHHRRSDQPGDVRPRVDPEPRVRLYGAAHGVPRPRRPHLGLATGQPDHRRRPPGHREVLPRDERGAQRRGHR